MLQALYVILNWLFILFMALISLFLHCLFTRCIDTRNNVKLELEGYTDMDMNITVSGCVSVDPVVWCDKYSPEVILLRCALKCYGCACRRYIYAFSKGESECFWLGLICVNDCFMW